MATPGANLWAQHRLVLSLVILRGFLPVTLTIFFTSVVIIVQTLRTFSQEDFFATISCAVDKILLLSKSGLQ
jgi:hypothetical protein